MTRNEHQLSGRNLDDLVDLVIGYHPPDKWRGGTLQNYRNAKRRNIPVLDIGNAPDRPLKSGLSALERLDPDAIGPIASILIRRALLPRP